MTYDDGCPARVSLTFYGKPSIYMPGTREQFKQLRPKLLALAGIAEGIRISDHDESVAGPGEKYIQTFWGKHEPNVIVRITPCQGDNHNVTLFSLIVIYEKTHQARHTRRPRIHTPMVARRIGFLDI